MALAVVGEGVISERITGLKKAEYEEFTDMGMFKADDVLDMYNFLTIFDGNLSHLLLDKY